MKRDMDIIRGILIAVEDADEPVEIIPECTDAVFGYHAALLMDAGLATGDVVDGPNLQPMAGSIFRLTWAGHEFLDAARSDTVWRTAKEKILKPGVSWTFEILKETLKTLAKQELARHGLSDLHM